VGNASTKIYLSTQILKSMRRIMGSQQFYYRKHTQETRLLEAVASHLSYNLHSNTRNLRSNSHPLTPDPKSQAKRAPPPPQRHALDIEQKATAKVDHPQNIEKRSHRIQHPVFESSMQGFFVCIEAACDRGVRCWVFLRWLCGDGQASRKWIPLFCWQRRG